MTGGREGNGRRLARAEEAGRGGEARAEGKLTRRGSSTRRKLDAEEAGRAGSLT